MKTFAFKLLKHTALTVLVLALLSINGCKPKNNDLSTYDATATYTIQNILYGNDAQQAMDIYLPANRTADSTKVFVLIHGGGWSAGDKADYQDFFNSLKALYPNYAVINLNYRLATTSSPAYPKQLNDIQSALNHIQLAKYGVSKQYLLFGSSAGGHLALLYGYAFDTDHYVKGICNTVGPADLTDTAYTNNAAYAGLLAAVTGNVTYAQNPALYAQVSPAKRVTPASPKTISFYGDTDPLIPSSQMGLLHSALNANGVYNEATMYTGEGHGGWNTTHTQDAIAKTINFINQYF